jgi:hypothetical protein
MFVRQVLGKAAKVMEHQVPRFFREYGRDRVQVLVKGFATCATERHVGHRKRGDKRSESRPESHRLVLDRR